MAEPNTTIASTGGALVTLATVTIGPLLGEYAIVVGLGLLGTLIALSESDHLPLKQSLIFVFKGVIFSVVFTGLITSFAMQYVPSEVGLTPYALLGAISFMIGWTSNKMEPLKDWFISFITRSKNESPK